eukprot:6474583-Amphidinium_carterae.1
MVHEPIVTDVSPSVAPHLNLSGKRTLESVNVGITPLAPKVPQTIETSCGMIEDDLDKLLSYVAHDLDTLLILLTKNTLARAWCVASRMTSKKCSSSAELQFVSHFCTTCRDQSWLGDWERVSLRRLRRHLGFTLLARVIGVYLTKHERAGEVTVAHLRRIHRVPIMMSGCDFMSEVEHCFQRSSEAHPKHH